MRPTRRLHSVVPPASSGSGRVRPTVSKRLQPAGSREPSGSSSRGHRGERPERFVVAVVAVERIKHIPSLSDERAKQASIGLVLAAGDADYDSLIGQPVDGHRNRATYGLNPTGATRTCACGCDGDVAGNRVFLPGHDQRAIHDRIAQERGTALGFVEWFDDTYGNARDLAPAEA